MVLDLYNNDTDQFLHVPTATQTSNYQYCEDYQYFYRLYDAILWEHLLYYDVALFPFHQFQIFLEYMSGL